jgi:DNA helicase HerA-like ATPase
VDGRPISVIDLSGVPTSIVSAVVSVLSRIVFDFAVWSRGERKRPVVLICEEAHRYIPNRTISRTSPVRDVLERIAKEGRKYGVSLGLVTQRPSDLAEGALSQCGTIFFSQTVEIKRRDDIFWFHIHLNIHLFRSDTA